MRVLIQISEERFMEIPHEQLPNIKLYTLDSSGIYHPDFNSLLVKMVNSQYINEHRWTDTQGVKPESKQTGYGPRHKGEWVPVDANLQPIPPAPTKNPNRP